MFAIIPIVVLLVASVFDLRFRRIPNWLTIPALLIPILWIDLFYVAVIILSLVLALLLGNLIGAGDIKLAAALTIWSHQLNWSQSWIIYACCLGGLFALISRQRRIPFAPFMALGALLSNLL